jgi:ApaG protein
MIQQITEGIKISVQSNFECSYFDGKGLRFGFNYFIEIENNNPHPVQLISRKWTILDALNENEIVKGEGVVGKQPIIQPFESYRYNSGCALQGPMGCMKGVYNMLRISDNHEFEVKIPNFRLCADFAQN